MTDLRALAYTVRQNPQDKTAALVLADALTEVIGDRTMALILVASMTRAVRDRSFWRGFRRAGARVRYLPVPGRT